MQDLSVIFKHLVARNEGKTDDGPIKVIGWFHFHGNAGVWYGFHGPLWRANSPFVTPMKMTFIECEDPSVYGVEQSMRKRKSDRRRRDKGLFMSFQPADLLPDFTDRLLNQLAIAKVEGLRNVVVSWDGKLLFGKKG